MIIRNIRIYKYSKILILLFGLLKNKKWELFSTGACCGKQLSLSYFLTSLLFISIVFLKFPLSLHAESKPPKKVLLLYSYDPRMPSMAFFEQGILKVFQDNNIDVEFYTEYMDLLRFPEKKHIFQLKDFYHSKYSNLKFEVIVAGDFRAYDFMLKYGEELFPKTPLVVSWTLTSNIQKNKLRPNMAAVFGQWDYKGNVELIFKLFPKIKNIYVIAGSSFDDLAPLDEFKKNISEYESRASFKYLINMPIEEIIKQTEKLPPDSAIYYLRLSQDSAGKIFIPKYSLSLIKNSANAPIFGAIDAYFGSGMLGGNLLNIEEYGRIAGNIVLRILNGEKADNIPIMENTSFSYIFDWRELKRWSISESSLPPGSIIRLKEYSTWDAFKLQIIGFSIFIIIESLLILVLLINRISLKRLKTELQVSEKHYRDLIELSPIAKVVHDTNIFLYLNPSAVKLFGAKSSEELIGKSIFDRVHPEYHNILINRNNEMKKGVIFPNLDEKLIKLDGTIIDAEVTAFPYINVGKPAIQVVIIDVSERKKMENALRKSEEQFKAIFNQAPMGIALIDSINGNIYEVNSKFGEIIGRGPDEIIDAINLESIIHPDDIEETKNFIALMNSGNSNGFNMNKRYKHKDGRFIWVHMTNAPVKANIKPNPCHLCMIEDITEQINTEIKLMKTLSELESKNAELEKFTYTVSHDLKSPLITIKGFTGQILADINNQKFARISSDIQRISNAASKMDGLLNDLLTLSRIGRFINPDTEFPMDLVIKEAIELLSGSIKEKKAEIFYDESMPTVRGDRLRIREVWQNLIENSIKYGNNQNPQIRIAYENTEKRIIFSIRDNGIGIEQEYHKKIFGIFEKLDNHSDGSGIGLALVKRIIEFHGGEIWVESEGKGKGSAFYFSLKRNS